MNKLYNLANIWSSHLSVAIENLTFLSNIIDIVDESMLVEYEEYFVIVTENMERTIGYIENLINLGLVNESFTSLEKYINIHIEEIIVYNQRINDMIEKVDKPISLKKK